MPEQDKEIHRESGRYAIELVVGETHELERRLGEGSISIGPEQLCPKADQFLPMDARVNWACFEPFETPAKYPWPRFFDYTGHDCGFFNWSRTRHIEHFQWHLSQLQTDLHVQIDSEQHIGTLIIAIDEASAGKLHLHFPDGEDSPSMIRKLSLQGPMEKFIITGKAPTKLSLTPKTSKRIHDAPLRIPEMPALERSTRQLELVNTAASQPIALNCLERFVGLEGLSLWGRVDDLTTLQALVQLKSLELRFMPQLLHLPKLDSWPALASVIAYNVEEATGKKLRAQIKSQEKVRPWSGYTSVTQLRKPEWWQKEFGRPFSGWSAARAKRANAAYDLAEQALRDAKTLDAAREAITTFTRSFNGLKGIDTVEREDLGTAVWQLADMNAAKALGVSQELADEWFDETRDY